MRNDKGILSKFILQENEFTFRGQLLNVRDSMLLCYCYIQKGQYECVKKVILKIGEKIANSESYFGKVFWLWVLGEYINKSKDENIYNNVGNTAAEIIGVIEENWEKPLKSWINTDLQEDLYLTNLSASYGALLSINNTLKSENIMQLMKKIKEFMFKKFMRGSRLASRISENAVFGDIGVTAVPFALVDAGNQILVGAIDEAEKYLVTEGVRLSNYDTYYGGCERNTLTLFMAWYYSEKGDMSKAKGLLVHIGNIIKRDGKLCNIDVETCKEEILYKYWVYKNGELAESPLAYILYAIAEQNISLKERNIGASVHTSIIHAGAGNGNPYISEASERYPGYPQPGDTITIRAITQPFDKTQKLSVSCYVNDSDSDTKVSMKPAATKEGDRIWEAQIGSFKAFDKISYHFELTEASNECIKSVNYEFSVREWVKLTDIKGISKSDAGINIYYQKVSCISGIPCLKISEQNGSLKYSFCLEDSYPEITILDTNELCQVTIFDVGQHKLSIEKQGTNLCFLDEKGSTVFESHDTAGFLNLLTDGTGKVQKVRFNLKMTGDDRVFGTGERYSHLDLRGQIVENYVYNQYRDQELRTYLPIPFIMNSKGYGLYFDTPFHAQFRFGTSLSDLMEFELDLDHVTQKLDAYVFMGKPKNILKEFSGVVGKPELPPKWGFGPWMSSNNWDNQQEVYKQAELTKKYEIPSTALVLEQWSDEATFYIFNDAQYRVKNGNTHLEYNDYTFPEWGRWPDPKKLVKDLHNDGLKVLLWQIPVMKYMDGISHAQRDEDERVMLEKGYHIKYENGEPYGVPCYEWFKKSLVPDLTNPEVKEWWLNKRLYLLKDIGIDGFKTDGGECIYGEDLVFSDGSSSNAMRNLYPNLYIKSYYDFIKEHTKGQGITFSRAGYTGAHKIPFLWAGDERSTFKAFEHSLKAGLSSAASGLTFWGWDLAGFHGDIPTAELFIRATEMAAFCPVMQYHAETKGEANQDRTPWNIAERTGDRNALGIYKKYADLRMNLLPYIYQQAMECCITGIPMMRTMFMEYPDDSSCTDMYQQYMFGECLLVAPVIKERATTKDVYFPEGKWLSLFDDEVFEGKSFNKIKADIGDIPVYIKENSIIPLNLSDEFSLCSHVSNDVTKYKNLCFMVYVSDSIQYSFKDDLENQVDINVTKSGEGIQIDIECNSMQLPIALILRDIDYNTEVIVNSTFIKKEVLGRDLLLRVSIF